MKKILLGTLASILAASSTAQINHRLPPDPADLQAAYCLGYYKLTDGMSSESIIQAAPFADRARLKQKLQIQAANRQRVQAYLAGRLEFIDPTGMLIASKQAEVDVTAGLEAVSNCAGMCQTRDCLMTCQIPEHLVAKRQRCDSLEFLPY